MERGNRFQRHAQIRRENASRNEIDKQIAVLSNTWKERRNCAIISKRKQIRRWHVPPEETDKIPESSGHSRQASTSEKYRSTKDAQSVYVRMPKENRGRGFVKISRGGIYTMRNGGTAVRCDCSVPKKTWKNRRHGEICRSLFTDSARGFNFGLQHGNPNRKENVVKDSRDSHETVRIRY